MTNQLWRFTDTTGTFTFPDADQYNTLYFPLANDAEFISSITPLGKGDIKISQNHFLMQPVTRDDLHNLKSGRNFWIYAPDGTVWSALGVSQFRRKEQVTVDAGILWHRISRECPETGLRAEIINFVPVSGEPVELMSVTITNCSDGARTITPTGVIPIFGRSADNLRDHRHVTSLLHRVHVAKQGVIVQPAMSFDERGHKINHHAYAVFGCEADGTLPRGCFPTLESFIGDNGCFEAPQAVLRNLEPARKTLRTHQGKETVGALRFSLRTLAPGESATYVLMGMILEKPQQALTLFKTFNSKEKFDRALHKNTAVWRKRVDSIQVTTGLPLFDNWFRWVTLQPVLRKIFGCSFLPDFDYGRGGKGWRDLWQDCLSLIFINPDEIRDILVANFGGVRIDGTNATIITKKPGFFIADRNKISRVWMDHGVWPFFTLLLYIHQTGDYSVLFENRTYFYDRQLSRAKEIDHTWNPHYKHCKHLHTRAGKIYRGSVLEHILVQHLSAFFHVGAHNTIRLEDADWNDGLDMARDKGESVAFTCFYAGNLYQIIELLRELKKRRKTSLSIAKELLILLDRVNGAPVDYANPAAKQAVLARYLKAVRCRISGKKVSITIDRLINDLGAKWRAIAALVQKKEWIDIDRQHGFFNGYYDNLGKRVEGCSRAGVRMTLTGQVFPIISGIASLEQTRKTYKTVCRYLRDKHSGGFRLNTDFTQPQFHLGRAFAFTYGEKENGAVFSHMCIMFANALYRRGLAVEGYTVLHSLFQLATDTPAGKIYPCLPEYFNGENRGMYCYLTGSASWFVMTTLTEVFGIKGRYGDLYIEPKLVRAQFAHSSIISATCNFAGIHLNAAFHNPHKKEYGGYAIRTITMQPKTLVYDQPAPGCIVIARKALAQLSAREGLSIEIELN
ncbi:MAG: cellobiose phosphorylase [Candidatus Omnitrophica bacterium]|nr:cellobiose phosphorylase [Candidatus Omnitrophota bacterium]